jgi:hypothetical protein
MNKMITALIGSGMLALSFNTAAIPIQYKGYDIDHMDIPVLLADAQDNAVGKKDRKRVAKAIRKHGKLVSSLDSGRKLGKRTRKLEKKLARLTLDMSLLDQVNLPSGGSDEVPENGNQGNGVKGNGVNGDGVKGDGVGGNGSASVPEPTIIALLGLGLLGIGAVRGLKKTA